MPQPRELPFDLHQTRAVGLDGKLESDPLR